MLISKTGGLCRPESPPVHSVYQCLCKVFLEYNLPNSINGKVKSVSLTIFFWTFLWQF